MTATKDTREAVRPTPGRADRFLMACLALALGVASVTVLWQTFIFSLACLGDSGATSPHCDSRWSVPFSVVIVTPLVALCAVSALATARAAREGCRLTRRERRRVIALFVILTLVGLAQPLGYVSVPFTWLVIGVFVLLVRGVAAVARSASRRWCGPAGA